MYRVVLYRICSSGLIISVIRILKINEYLNLLSLLAIVEDSILWHNDKSTYLMCIISRLAVGMILPLFACLKCSNTLPIHPSYDYTVQLIPDFCNMKMAPVWTHTDPVQVTVEKQANSNKLWWIRAVALILSLQCRHLVNDNETAIYFPTTAR